MIILRTLFEPRYMKPISHALVAHMGLSKSQFELIVYHKTNRANVVRSYVGIYIDDTDPMWSQLTLQYGDVVDELYRVGNNVHLTS